MGSRVRLLLLLAVLFIGALPLSAHALPLLHDWSRRAGDAGDQYGNSVCVDAAGNVVFAGEFTGSVDFGGGAMTSAGGYDLYVTKLDALGNFMWSRRYGDADLQLAKTVTVDRTDDSVLFTGIFMGSVDFGGGPLVSAGAFDIFLVKLDRFGNHVWSQRFGNVGSQRGYGVTVDIDGNVVLTGSFDDKVDFGGGSMTSAGSSDVYIAVFDRDGNHQWSARYGDAAMQTAFSVATDEDRNIVATGYFSGSMDFGGGPIVCAGATDIFVAKVDRNGDHLWSQAFGDHLSQNGNSVALDSAGNIFIGGDFEGSVDFGGGAITSGGWFDMFVVKLDRWGGHVWSHGFGDAFGQFVGGVAVDGADNVAVTGYFEGTMNLGGETLDAGVTGATDVYVGQFDPAGTHIWSAEYGDEADYQYGLWCAADPAGSLYVVGYFAGAINFGGGTITSNGVNDAFLAKFSSPAPAIGGIIDVPGDQGGWARILFSRSVADKVGTSPNPVINYHVFRRIEDFALLARVSSEGREAGPSLDLPAAFGNSPLIALDGRTFWRAPQPAFETWEAVATVPARQQTLYIGLVPTLADSGAVLNQTVYFVMAQTTTPWVYYDSPPDSGYSVDNLSPAMPQNLGGTPVVSPAALTIVWDANTEHDLSHYAVYRGTTAAFVPGASNRIAIPATPQFVDDDWQWNSGFYYKVAALDVNGNESGYALLSPQAITGIGDDAPLASFLSQNQPNPFSSSTRIAFGLGEAADVRVRIYDVAGRLVRDLADARYAADRHVITWDGRDNSGRAVAGGVYFCRLDAGTFVQTRKLLLMR